MIEKLKAFLANRTNLILVVILTLILGTAMFGIWKIFLSPKGPEVLEEIELTFNPDGPYAMLIPRRDGNAINLNIFRISEYEAFSYQISYSDEEGIERGAGDLNTWVKVEKGKGDHEQEILLGTCSQGFSTGNEHCVFDKGVENGNLILRFKKDKKAYVVKTTWHLQKPDVALGKITSSEDHFKYETKAEREELATVAFSLVHDLIGSPKLPEGKQVVGNVYAFNLPITKTFPKGDVMIELVDKPGVDAKIYRYVEADNKWEELNTKIDGNLLKVQASGAGIFAVLRASN